VNTFHVYLIAGAIFVVLVAATIIAGRFVARQ
jgi:hypothetical protein